MISVAMITRNGTAHLSEQLESIAVQARAPDELVISDDASTDGTVALCREFAAAAPFTVRIIANRTALGSTANRAQSIEACTGSIVALADQDDVWHPDKLALMERALLPPGGPELAFSDGVVVDEQRRPLGLGLWDSFGFDDRRRAQVEQGQAFRELLDRNFAAGPATVFRVTLLEAALPVPPGVRADAWLALLAAATSRVIAVPDRLIEYRQSSGQQIGATVHWRARLRRRLINAMPLQLRARIERTSPLDAKLRRLDPLRARLLELDGTAHAPRPGCLEAVEDRIAHWRVRSSLPPRRRDRLPAIRAELATNRYSRYSQGARSAVADLVYPVAR